MTKISGGCLYSRVTYSGDADIQRIVNCHCFAWTGYHVRSRIEV